jgi:hypothetical protein
MVQLQDLVIECLLRSIKNVPASVPQGGATRRQMQLELCEIPLAGAPEILGNEGYPARRGNDGSLSSTVRGWLILH